MTQDSAGWGEPGSEIAEDAPGQERPWFKRKRFIIPGVFLALGLVGSVLPDEESTPIDASPSGSEVSASPSAISTPSPTPPPKSAAEIAAEAKEAKALEDAAKKEAAKQEAARVAAERPVAINKRDFAKLVKDPEAYTGRFFIVFGEVTQFDAATGDAIFLANAGATRDPIAYGYTKYEDNAMFSGEASMLSDVVEDDVFRATVEVMGSHSYDTQIGGNTTVPHFRLTGIKVYGSTK